MADPAELQAKLKLLSDAYAAQLPEKLRLLKLTWQRLNHDVWDEEIYSNLYRMVHSLTGSGKTFGFAAISVAAAELERYLKLAAGTKNVLTAAQCAHLQGLFDVLMHSAVQAHQPDEALAVAIMPSGNEIRTAGGFPRHVFVVDDDIELAEELKTQLNYFGYEVSVFHTLSDFQTAMQGKAEGVVLMDVSFPEDSLGGIHIMAQVQQGRELTLPGIFLSAHGDLSVRLEAIRAGGVAYLTKPVNIGVLIDKLDELTSPHVAAAYRVLIVDDEVQLTGYYAATLQQVGMSVRVVNDPLAVMPSLLDYSPDLILIDMYMPGCNGMELAQVIRQMDAFISIPIVFLSAEVDLDKRLIAMGMGGDDFLTKPIAPQHLISAVTSRISRSHLLRSFMVRDSLTGLLNHTAIKDQLAHEMARAKRQKKSLSFAMVDIDHFKQVNDSFGHPVGDRVIKSLSRLLKQRLRENDLVGRYGGEEFAVIIVDADGVTAKKILDSIRRDFAQLRHLAEQQEFSVSFSCGIAELADFDEVSRLTDAADKALYLAKHAGRNQIVIADDNTLRQ